jgi:thioredoxin reductase (NADPH)
MLAGEDIKAIPLFASLDAAGLERVAEGAADIRLDVGEYAVNEGDERAFFAVLSGKLEVVKLFDGIERVLGARLPGTIFGEVPLAMGTPFPAGYRATEPSRVLRLDVRHYYTLAAEAPDVALRMGALARERIGGLQSVNAEGPRPRLTLLGHRYDTASTGLRRFLGQISHTWVEPGTADLAHHWAKPLPADDQLPALHFDDGTMMFRPPMRTLAEHLGLQTCAHHAEYDAVIIGGGPAGLAAAVYGASEGLRTIVVEREAPGGQAGTSSRIENYLGFPTGVSGDELAGRALQQARRLGAEILITRAIERVDPATRTLHLDGGDTLSARAIVLATGVSWRRLPVEGFDRLIGNGVYYGAARSEAGLAHGLDVHLIGAGNSAGQAALYFASHARSVTLIHRGDAIGKTMSQYLVGQIAAKQNIHVALQSEVRKIYGDGHLTAIDILNRADNTVRHVESGGLFVFIGADAETGWLPQEIARDDKGYVLTGDDVAPTGRWPGGRDPYLLETSMPGIFACGDVRRSPVKRVAAAVGEGSMAIAFVHQYLAQQSLRPLG